ncbi:MAG: hypothetical protein K8T91_09995 [Planctomycetes bacterium]|nr:hypothetical protein [Planctomycetota bacterium]
MPQPAPPPPNTTARRFIWRRMFQFRLRTLLILTTIIAVALGWWSYKAHQHREVVTAITSAGAEVSYTLEDPSQFGDDPYQSFWPSWLINLVGVDYFARLDCVRFVNVRNTGAVLQCLDGFTIRRLDLSHSRITDADLQRLERLNLKELDVSETQITDAGLQHLQSLRSLIAINLRDTQITDAGIEHLNGLDNLEGLNISKTRVTDAGIKRLQRLPSLAVLDLRDTAISDAGLRHLGTFVALIGLDVRGTGITERGLEHLGELTALDILLVSTEIDSSGEAALLRKKLPKCDIRKGKLESIGISTHSR